MASIISKETIDLINNTADIVSLVGDYTKLTKKGPNDWWGCCPFHGEKTASFHVDGDKHFYYCFSCHASGNISKFVMEMEKITFPEALEFIAKRNGIPVKYQQGSNQQKNPETEKIALNKELYSKTAGMFHYMLMETEQGKFALNYIRERGLTDDTLKKFKIGYSPADRYWLKKFLLKKNYSNDFLNQTGLFSRNYQEVSLFSDRLMFPIFNRNGETVAFGGRILHPQGPKDSKYMNSPEVIHYKKRETLYAFNFAKKPISDNKKVILCEGYMDCIAYHQCGIEYAVAPLGTALTEEQVKILRGFADTVLLSFDSDNAGQNATIKAINMCRQQGLEVKIIQLKGGKDPAEIMLNYGKENLTAQVNNAILDSDFLLNRLGKIYPLDTPDGKTKAALEFFPYIDSLKSDIQKESCLEKLTQAFNLKPEAVKRDYLNRKQAQERITNHRQNNQINEQVQIRLDAELRGLIAATTNPESFKQLRSSLKVEDFRNPAAKSLYIILEDCFQADSYSIPDILGQMENNALAQLITDEISSGVYQNTDTMTVINDTIKFVKKNIIDEQRNKLLERIRNFTVVTQDDQTQLNTLLTEKMELDRQMQALSK